MLNRPIFALQLRPGPHVTEAEAVRDLRALLKKSLRTFGLTCIRCEIVRPDEQSVALEVSST